MVIRQGQLRSRFDILPACSRRCRTRRRKTRS